jgi:son of sevenless-like protein
MPKNSKKLKLLDIDPLELARQLTILESNLYQKVRPLECLMRSRRSGEFHDNITTIIQLCNKVRLRLSWLALSLSHRCREQIALWVTDAILQPEASRKRAAVLKYMISVADVRRLGCLSSLYTSQSLSQRCRSLNNYSTMVAIISGLNNPPIRRLKRTWFHLSPKVNSHHSACEETIDTAKNFASYRTTLAKIAAPCVPFIGTLKHFSQKANTDRHFRSLLDGSYVHPRWA